MITNRKLFYDSKTNFFGTSIVLNTRLLKRRDIDGGMDEFRSDSQVNISKRIV